MHRVQQHTYTSRRKRKVCFPLFDHRFWLRRSWSVFGMMGLLPVPSCTVVWHSPSRHTVIYKPMSVREKRKHRTQQDLQVWGRRQNFELTDISTSAGISHYHRATSSSTLGGSASGRIVIIFSLTAVSYVCFPVMDLSSLLACLLFVLQLPGIFAGLREGEQSDTRWAHCELRNKKKKKKADRSWVQQAKNRRLWVRLVGTYGWVAWKITGSEDLCLPSSSKSFSFLSNAGRTSESGKTDKLRQGLQQGACISFKYLIKIHDSMIIGVAGQLSHNNIHHSCVTWCHWPTVAPIKNNNSANRIFSALSQDLFFICLTFI